MANQTEQIKVTGDSVFNHDYRRFGFSHDYRRFSVTVFSHHHKVLPSLASFNKFV
uniref:Uncharacterized protein n=1 Tax=Helianthus annuus TaxID=4232 RepID=A0A251RVV3_HELAN